MTAAPVRSRTADHAACLNCGAPVSARYCATCGQEARDPDPPARVLGREMVAEALGADSRTWRTLWLLLTRPGALTVEYFAGKRARYLEPLRLYLLVSALFLAMVLFTSAGESMFQVQAPDDVGVSPERFREAFFNIWPWFLVGLVPAFAAAYALLLWPRRASFTRHLVFTLHLHAFGFAALTFAGMLWYVPPTALGTSLAMAMLLAPPLYLVLALRRAYGISWAGSLATALGASFINTLIAGGSTYLTYVTVVWLS